MNRPDPSTSLYAELLGSDLARLPVPLRAIHERSGTRTYRGEVVVRAGVGPIARLFAWAARLPPPYAGPIEVEIIADATAEQWTRRFGTHAMRSRLCLNARFLHERLGLAQFDFALDAVEATIRWRVARVRAVGVPLPASWFAGVSAVEFVGGGRYRFDVRAELPGIGLLVHYAGWLDVG
jgi:hypothetical protein